MIKRRLTSASLLFLLTFAAWAMTGAAPVTDDRTIWWAPQFEYDHKQMEVQLSGKDGRQAWIEQDGARIQAERIFWNRRTRIGRCYERVKITDLTNDTVITGEEAWHYSEDLHSVVRINPKMHLEKDEITVYADEMHRFGKQALAEARGNVRIETKDGTAWGDKAVYYQKRGELILSGDPWLEQKTNTHRANEIIFFRDDNKVVLRGEAKLMQGREHIRAHYIEILDLDKTNTKATNQGPRTKNESSTNRKNRLAFFKDDVRIYRHAKNGVLESVTVGEDGEFHERRGYVCLTGSPQMINVSDNTVTSGAVMEQYRDEDLAIIKGNAFIERGYRTVTAQLIRYNTKTKIAELAGNPVISEYGDSYRADFVTYDTSKDIISWRGSTMAVIGTASQGVKESAWAAKNNAAIFTLTGAANGANVIKAVGNVWLSTSGRAVTNKGKVSWGKRADDADAIPRGTHIVINDTWSWVDLLGRDGLMLRLRGPAHLVLSAAEWETPAAPTNQQSKQTNAIQTKGAGKTNLQARGETATSSTSSVSSKGVQALAGPLETKSSAAIGSTSSVSLLTVNTITNMKIASEITNSVLDRVEGLTNRKGGAEAVKTNVKSGARLPTRRMGVSSWVLHKGIILAKPGSAAIMNITSGVFVCHDLRVPLIAEAKTNGEIKILVLSNQKGLQANIGLPSMRLVTFRSNAETEDFHIKNDRVLARKVTSDQPLSLRTESVRAIDAVIESRLSNELRIQVLALSNLAASNTNQPAETDLDETVLSNRQLILRPQQEMLHSFYVSLTNIAATNTPGQPVVFSLTSKVNTGLPSEAKLFWTGEVSRWVTDILGGQEFWETSQMPKKQTDYGELIDEVRGLWIVWGVQPAKRPEPGRGRGRE